MIKYKYISNKQDLNEMCEELKQYKVLAIDLECENNLHHYGSYISLIQITASKKNWIVDIITLKELGLLKNIFEDKEIQKIFHDVSFDLRILNYEFKVNAKNLYDTQIAALLIGEKNVGLGSLLEKFFSIKKESKFQMADWTLRPINPEMMAYAVKDTAYLIELKKLIDAKIKELGREEWLRQELEHLEEKDYDYKDLGFEDMKGTSKLLPREKIFAKKMYEYRETLAKKINKPVHRIMPNKRIIDLATNPPKTKEEWKQLKGMHPAIRAKALVIYFESKKIPITEEPKEKRERKNYTEEQKIQLQELEDTRIKVGKKHEIEPYLVMSKEQVHEAVRKKNYDSLRLWQKELITKETKLFQ